MPHNTRGIERERKLKHLLEECGWVVMRAAGSKGEADLIALADGFVLHPVYNRPIEVERAVLLIEVKSTAAGPFAGFGPADRRALAAVARRCGAEAWLAWWPPRARGAKWIGMDAWPGSSGGKRTTAPARAEAASNASSVKVASVADKPHTTPPRPRRSSVPVA